MTSAGADSGGRVAHRYRVHQAIRDRILSGASTPGTRLIETELATEMGVSRAPVREAIRLLEQEGLVETFSHRGTVVVGVPDDEIASIYELRGVIEARATVRAFRHVTEADLDQLAALAARMDQALARGDIDSVAELDLAFHGRIVELSRLQLMRHIWSSLDGFVRLRTFQRLDRRGQEARSVSGSGAVTHGDLIDALRDKDAARARRLAFEHVVMRGSPHRSLREFRDPAPGAADTEASPGTP
jgi:DNA-binding GntR family transcriptional regulator